MTTPTDKTDALVALDLAIEQAAGSRVTLHLTRAKQLREALAAQAPAAVAGDGEATRAKFERWVSKRWGCALDRWADSGKYRYDSTNEWWECWQEALSRPAAAATVPDMADAIAAGDGTLHGAIDYWQSRALRAEATLAAAPTPPAVDEAMVFRMAFWMAKHDGHDDPHHLIWEGSPPEPWGEVWCRYEDDARAALTAALAKQAAHQADDGEGGRER